MPKRDAPPLAADLLQGTLDLLILQVLGPGPGHGHAIAHGIERRSDDVLQVEHGSLYPALHRLEDRGWIASFWGSSENNRRARYYRLTPSGRKQLTGQTSRWRRLAGAVDRVLGSAAAGERAVNLRRFFHRQAWHRERAAELEAYLEEETADNLARGLPPGAARAAAERKLGNRTRILEEIYHANSIAWLEALWQDARTAWRQAVRAPGVTLAAAVILALGIGANTAMFSVVYGELKPLPFPHPERLVAVLESSQQFPRMGVSYPDYLDWREGNHSFSDLAAMRGSDMILLHRGAPAMVIGARVTANYFRMLGAAPILGRTFTPTEDRPGAAPVVVISERFWRERLGGDPHCLGQTLDLDGEARALIGVMPAGFPGLQPDARQSQFWTPLGAFAGENASLLNRGNHAGILALGRLKAGVTLTAARADLAGVAEGLAQAHPATNAGVTAAAQSYLDLVVGDTLLALLILLAAVGLVLLIACANVANLLLARAATRRRAEALRRALGASRARLAREVLIGALGLAVAGCGAGLLLAHLVLRLAAATLPEALPRAPQLALDARVLGFAVGAALLTSALCALAPAFQAGRTPIAEALQSGGRGAAAPGERLRGLLVGSEMALALLLLLGAGFLLRTLARLQRVDLGFDPRSTLTFIVGLPENRYPDAARQSVFFQQTLDRMAAAPGVRAAGGIYPLPLGGNDWEEGFLFVGRPAPEPGREPTADIAAVRGELFAALGMRLLRGRGFSEQDGARSPQVAVVDDSFVERYWPESASLDAALGRQINLDGGIRVIVGVVAHARNASLDGAVRPAVYIPQEQSLLNTGVLSYALRVDRGDPMALRAAALAAIAAVDPDQPVTDAQTMEQRVGQALADRRRALGLLGGFALLALALAATGVYAVLAYQVARRTQEIGVRMALGAERGRVLGMVMGEGLRMAALGGAAGWVAAALLGRAVAAVLPGVDWNDPATLILAPLALLAIGALACYLPARRASRVDPATALRAE